MKRVFEVGRIYACVVRVFHSKNRVFDGSKRALVVCDKKHETGTNVSFLFQGVKEFGDVLCCAPIPEPSEISVVLRMLSDSDVFVYVQPGMRLEETTAAEAAADEIELIRKYRSLTPDLQGRVWNTLNYEYKLVRGYGVKLDEIF